MTNDPLISPSDVMPPGNRSPLTAAHPKIKTSEVITEILVSRLELSLVAALLSLLMGSAQGGVVFIPLPGMSVQPRKDQGDCEVLASPAYQSLCEEDATRHVASTDD